MTLVGLALTTLFASGCEIEAQSRSVDGSFDRTIKVSGPVDLDIQSRSGQINIRVGDGDAVRVVGRIRAYGSFSAFSGVYTPEEQASSLSSSPPIEQSGNAISVGDIRQPGLGANVSVSYDVTVPANTRLRSVSRSGDQSIDMVRGPVAASSRSGNIHLREVGGDVEIETRSGEVDLRLPADGGAVLDVETRSGAIDSSVATRIDRGHARRHVRGTIGAGGRRVEIHTRSGSVRIR
jgi:hypothetical protein